MIRIRFTHVSHTLHVRFTYASNALHKRRKWMFHTHYKIWSTMQIMQRRCCNNVKSSFGAVDHMPCPDTPSPSQSPRLEVLDAKAHRGVVQSHQWSKLTRHLGSKQTWRTSMPTQRHDLILIWSYLRSEVHMAKSWWPTWPRSNLLQKTVHSGIRRVSQQILRSTSYDPATSWHTGH